MSMPDQVEIDAVSVPGQDDAEYIAAIEFLNAVEEPTEEDLLKLILEDEIRIDANLLPPETAEEALQRVRAEQKEKREARRRLMGSAVVIAADAPIDPIVA